MSRRKKTPFVVHEGTGKKYVEVAAIMSPLVPFIDGLKVTFFGKGKTAYLEVDDAIKWCQEEAKYHSRKKYEDIVRVLQKLKDQPVDSTPES